VRRRILLPRWVSAAWEVYVDECKTGHEKYCPHVKIESNPEYKVLKSGRRRWWKEAPAEKARIQWRAASGRICGEWYLGRREGGGGGYGEEEKVTVVDENPVVSSPRPNKLLGGGAVPGVAARRGSTTRSAGASRKREVARLSEGFGCQPNS